MGFHVNPAVWYSATYLRSSSKSAVKLLTQSTCIGSLSQNVQMRIVSSKRAMFVLFFVGFDYSVGEELAGILGIADDTCWFSFLRVEMTLII